MIDPTTAHLMVPLGLLSLAFPVLAFSPVGDTPSLMLGVGLSIAAAAWVVSQWLSALFCEVPGA